ncbi:MAG: methylmalonyl-CoA mutase small subunit [Bacteroidales bacterium]|nr:methylmalonyl-CoA mutase small subunit [Bacteroidales bacterium]
MKGKKDRLFREFPPVSTPAWEEKIREDLKGADYEKKLLWRTIEGFTVKPYYRSDDIAGFDYQQARPGVFPFPRGTKIGDNSWLIRQQLWVEDINEANRKALDLIEKGVTSLEFMILKGPVLTQQSFNILIRDIPLSAVELNFSGYSCEVITERLVQHVNERSVENSALKGSVNFDPLGRLSRKGHFNYDSEKLSFEMLVRLVKDTIHLTRFRTIGINAGIFHNAGASIVQELAFGLAMGAEYLSVLSDRGLSVNVTSAKMVFHFAISLNYFMEIAKYRVARFLWSKILEAFAPECREPMFIHAETGRWNMTVYDPYVNMLRTTTESMSAILSGVDVLTVLPFDMTFEKPSPFAERIARNQQIILREEACFDKVIDPAAGSYYIESLTDSIAAEAWKLFLAVHEKGGFTAAMKQGFIQQQVIETAQQRDLAIATRRALCIGTNRYPGFVEAYSEKPVDYAIEHDCATRAGEGHGDNDNCFDHQYNTCDCREGKCDCSCCNADKRLVQPIRSYRGTLEYEKLRLKTDLSGRKPRIFMLTIGDLSMRLARAQFAGDFFACAGYDIIDNAGFDTVDEGIKAALKAKADVVVLCSSDDEYAIFAPQAYDKLKGRSVLVVAGWPACVEELKAKGIEYFIHIGSNNLETLKHFHQKLGINET